MLIADSKTGFMGIRIGQEISLESRLHLKTPFRFGLQSAYSPYISGFRHRNAVTNHPNVGKNLW